MSARAGRDGGDFLGCIGRAAFADLGDRYHGRLRLEPPSTEETRSRVLAAAYSSVFCALERSPPTSARTASFQSRGAHTRVASGVEHAAPRRHRATSAPRMGLVDGKDGAFMSESKPQGRGTPSRTPGHEGALIPVFAADRLLRRHTVEVEDSALGKVASWISPSGPENTFVEVPRAARATSAFSGWLMQIASGRCLRVCSSRSSKLFPAPKPKRRI